MAVSHLCMNCGHDMARVRAHRELHYNLPVVTCPTCAKVQVRRQHPLKANLRAVRRLDWTLTILLVQLLCFLTLAGATAATAVGTVVLLTGITLGEADVRWLAVVIAAVTGFVIVPLLSGAWLTAGLAHWRRRSDVWIAWATSVAGVIIIGCVVSSFVMAREGEVLTLGDLALSLVIGEAILAGFIFALPALFVLCVLTAIALLGIPLGRSVERLLNAFARWRRTALRKRYRRTLGRFGT